MTCEYPSSWFQTCWFNALCDHFRPHCASHVALALRRWSHWQGLRKDCIIGKTSCMISLIY